MDLSFSLNHIVNDGISRELSSITYATMDDAIECILQLGIGMQLVKLDLNNAYCIVQILPYDQHLLEIAWEGETYIDCALPTGLRSVPFKKLFGGGTHDDLGTAQIWNMPPDPLPG